MRNPNINMILFMYLIHFLSASNNVENASTIIMFGFLHNESRKFGIHLELDAYREHENTQKSR